MKNLVIGTIIVTAAACLMAIIPHVNVSKEENYSKPEENICASIAFGSGDTIINMDSVSDIYDFADVAIIGTITEKEAATMTEHSVFPFTPINMRVDKVIKGNIKGETINFGVAGGTVTVKTFIENTKNTWERAAKMGLTSLSLEEQNSKYVEYISNFKKELAVGDTYIILLKYSEGFGYSAIDDNGIIPLESLEMASIVNSKEDIVQLASIN